MATRSKSRTVYLSTTNENNALAFALNGLAKNNKFSALCSPVAPIERNHALFTINLTAKIVKVER